MTIEEFKKTKFSAGMKIKYSNAVYDVVSVDFKEYLFGFSFDVYSCNELSWARCENVKLVK